jgi:hypothetical protein
MKCVECLSKNARRRKLEGWEWIFSPLVVPVTCNRCLRWYYYPTFMLLLDKLAGSGHDR